MTFLFELIGTPPQKTIKHELAILQEKTKMYPQISKICKIITITDQKISAVSTNLATIAQKKKNLSTFFQSFLF